MALHQAQLSTQGDKVDIIMHGFVVGLIYVVVQSYRFEYRSILESKTPVRDARETRISFDHQRGAFATM